MRPDDVRKAASLRSAGDQPRVFARRAQSRRWAVLTNRRTQLMLPWEDPQGARSFPAPLFACAGGPTLVCSPHCRHPTSLGSGGRPAHPGLPQGERVSAAGIIAAPTPSSIPNSRGGGARHRCTRIAGLLQQGSSRRGSCLLSNLAKASYTALHYQESPHPNRAIPSILFSTSTGCFVTPRGSPPRQRTDGAGFTSENWRAALKEPWKASKQGCCCCARSGWAARAGRLSISRVDAMHAMRIQQDIEAIFRPACGRAYSRTWTQRILGRYADD